MSRIPLLGKHIESYYDMSAGRDADRIIRDHIAGKLKDQIARVAQAENAILDNGGLAYMSKTRGAKTRLQTLTDRIGTAAPGYAFTGALKVGHAELAKVYAFDEALLTYVEQITAAVDALLEAANQGEGINEAITALENVVIEADSAFTLRKDLISGLA
jgi:hypothetical protein